MSLRTATAVLTVSLAAVGAVLAQPNPDRDAYFGDAKGSSTHRVTIWSHL